MREYPDELRIARMTAGDIPRVHELESICFSAPWDIEAYYGELTNPTALYLTASVAGRILGFGGMWAVRDEAHIVTLAVDPEYRRRGIARTLLHALLVQARVRGVTVVTLEVRVSNVAAQALYASFGFIPIARRRRYYPDNNEDALVMRLLLDSQEAC